MADNVWMQHNPTTGKGCDPESYGAPGDKEPTPSEYPDMTSDDGYHDLAAQNENAAYHKNPAVSALPDNLEGTPYPQAAGDSGNPSAAEGSTGPSGY